MADADDGTTEPEVGEVRLHRYRTALRWSGSTGVGYERYDRTHEAWAQPDLARLTLSGDAAFGGRADLLNPEQLLVLAASSCQLLSFIALAARARIDVVAYEDAALGEMPERAAAPASIESIVLRPTIEIRRGAPRQGPAARAPRPRGVLHRQQPPHRGHGGTDPRVHGRMTVVLSQDWRSNGTPGVPGHFDVRRLTVDVRHSAPDGWPAIQVRSARHRRLPSLRPRPSAARDAQPANEVSEADP